MKVQKIDHTFDDDLISAGGGYCLTAEIGTEDIDNAIVNVIVEMMSKLAAAGIVSETLVNAHGCLCHGQHARNFVYIPDDAFALRDMVHVAPLT